MLDYEPYLKQKFSNWVIFVFEDGKTFGSDNFKEKDYFKYVSGKVTLTGYTKRKTLLNTVIYWCYLKKCLDQDRMLLKSLPITKLVVEKICLVFMYFFITDSCMITTKSWRCPCEFTCIQEQETYFSKTPLHTYR